MEQYQDLLNEIYYDINNHGSFGGATRLFNAAKQVAPSITINQVREWLQSQEVYSNFKPKKNRFPRLPVIVDRVDEQWQADVMDMTFWQSSNDNHRYLLVVIDCLSRYAWVVPLQDKSSINVINAFQSILEGERKPEKLQTDQGREFKNTRFRNFCSSNGIHYFTTTDATIKCALAERFIRTLRGRIYRFIYWKHTNRYIDDLQAIVDNYNNSHHRTIKTTPASVDRSNQISIVETIQRGIKTDPNRKQKFNVNETVKIPLNTNNFEKDAVQKWTDEVFKVSRVKNTPQKFVYKLQDLTGENVSSVFYPEELQKVKYDPDSMYRVERILRRVYDRRRRQYKYLVRWEGWPRKFDSWVDQLEDLSIRND